MFDGILRCAQLPHICLIPLQPQHRHSINLHKHSKHPEIAIELSSKGFQSKMYADRFVRCSPQPLHYFLSSYKKTDTLGFANIGKLEI